MKKFEYKIVSLEDNELVSKLNVMGNEGWEVVSILDKDSLNRHLWIRLLFKRELGPL
jgi:hypothetical protein